MKAKFIVFMVALLGCTALFAQTETILSDNALVPKDLGARLFAGNASKKETGAVYKWTVVTDKSMTKTDKSGSPDMTDGGVLHGMSEANSVFTHGKCTAEAVFDLKKEYPLTRVVVYFRKQTNHKNFNVSKLKVYTGNDGKSFEYAGSESGDKAVLAKAFGKSQLWKLELKLKDKKARYVKIRLDKKAKEGYQLVLCEMVIYGLTQ